MERYFDDRGNELTEDGYIEWCEREEQRRTDRLGDQEPVMEGE